MLITFAKYRVCYFCRIFLDISYRKKHYEIERKITGKPGII